jgi:hypothetical protein
VSPLGDLGKNGKKKNRGFGPLSNHADRATSACWRSSANFLQIEGVAWSVQRIHPVVSLSFLDRSRYYFFQVAPQLSSRGWVDPDPDPPLLRKSGSAGNRTQDLWICSQKLWLLDHRGSRKKMVIYHKSRCESGRYRIFQKELYNFERVYTFIQRSYTTFWTVIM